MSFFGSRRQTDTRPGENRPGDSTSPTRDSTAQRPQPPQSPVAPTPQVGFETVLGTSSTLEGVLRSSANVRLDGTFTGTLEITGNVLVGETAKINADINAKNISIAGAVRGNVSGKKVQILRTGRVWGDIRAAALTTEEGAFIDGKITMVSQDPINPPDFGTLFNRTDTALDDSIANRPPTESRKTDEVPVVRGLGATEDEPTPIGESDSQRGTDEVVGEGTRYEQNRPDLSVDVPVSAVPSMTGSGHNASTTAVDAEAELDTLTGGSGSAPVQDVTPINRVSAAAPLTDTEDRADKLAADYGKTPEDELSPRPNPSTD